jgi:hypothetical protein
MPAYEKPPATPVDGYSVRIGTGDCNKAAILTHLDIRKIITSHILIFDYLYYSSVS